MNAPLPATEAAVSSTAGDGWVAFNDSDLADAIYDADALLKGEQERLAPMYGEVERMRAHLVERLKERGATAVPHDSLTVELRTTKRIDKRISELRALVKLVPADELQKGLYLHTPAPEWKADARYLKPLAKKYGGEIAQVIDRGLVEVTERVVLFIEPRKAALKVVGPAAIAHEGHTDVY